MSLLPILAAVGQWVLPATNLADPLRDRPVLILCVFEFCLAGACITLWRAAPDFKVFRGLGAYFALTGMDHALQYFTGQGARVYIGAFTSPILVEAAADAMQETRRRWTRLLWPFYAIEFFAGFAPWLAFAQSWGVDASELALGWMSWRGLQRGGRTRLVAAAFAVFTLTRLTISADFRAVTSIPIYLEIHGWRAYVTSPVNVMLGILTLVVCFHDLLQDRRDKQRLASEMEAARAVQQVLIPEEIPTVPGFAIESVYRPAGEVGGDFFQILPTAAGGVLIVIGDVSGKGMPAAMTVSLLVGTVRTLAHFVQSPGEILAAGTAYAESRFELSPGVQLTLITDGVVEARDKSGRLFGFESTCALCSRPAEEIVRAAQRFGQEDDITVVTLAREPVAVGSTAEVNGEWSVISGQ